MSVRTATVSNVDHAHHHQHQHQHQHHRSSSTFLYNGSAASKSPASVPPSPVVTRSSSTHSLTGWFTLPPTPEPSPPGSVHVSPPSSPISSSSIKSRRKKEKPVAGEGKEKIKRFFQPLKLDDESLRYNMIPASASLPGSFSSSFYGNAAAETETSSLGRGEAFSLSFEEPTSPILPKVKLSFPTIMSDEEDNWTAPPVRRISKSSVRTTRPTAESPLLQEPSSHTTTTTTSSTSSRRTIDRRSYKYSVPSTVDVDQPSANVDQRRSGGISPVRTRSLPIRSATMLQGSSSSRPASPSTSRSSNPAKWRSASPANKHVKSSRMQTTSVPQSTATSTRSSSVPRASPQLPSSYSKGKAHDSPSFFSSSSLTTSNKLGARMLRIPYQVSHNFNSRVELPLLRNYQHDMAIVLSSSLEPLVTLFFLLMISTIACMSVSAALFGGFALTFYDDVGNRVEHFREGFGAGQKRVVESVENLKCSFEKVMVEAKVVFDQGLNDWRRRISVVHDQARAGRTRSSAEVCPDHIDKRHTSSSTSSTQASSPKCLDGEAAQCSVPDLSQTNTQQKGSTRGRPARNSRRRSASAGMFSRPLSRSGRFPNGGRAEVPDKLNEQAERRSHSSQGGGGEGTGWFSDEDALPYDVPPSTPFDRSRAPSPHGPFSRSRCPSSDNQFEGKKKYCESQNSTNMNSNHPKLPPRPALKILIPSITFALLYTLCKIFHELWSSSRSSSSSRRRNNSRSFSTTSSSVPI